MSPTKSVISIRRYETSGAASNTKRVIRENKEKLKMIIEHTN
jgi:hypothetical protein